MQAVHGLIRGEALALDGQEFRWSGDHGLEAILERAAVRRLGLAQLVDDQHLALKVIAPRGRQVFVVQLLDVGQGLTTDGPKERRPHRVFTRAWVATMQHGVIDLNVGVLHLEGHHVKHVVALDGVRDHALHVFEPWGGVNTCGHGRAGVAPAVTVDQAFTSA